MNNWIKDFEKKSFKKKKKIKLNKVRGHGISQKQRCTMSKQEVEELLLKNNIITVDKLREFCKKHPEAPSVDYIIYRYGSWSLFKNKLFPHLKKEISYEKWYKLFVQFGIYTFEKARDARNKYPEIFPSTCAIQYHFGSWSNFKRILIANTYSDIIENFIVLKKKLKKTPTLADCDKYGVAVFNIIGTVFKNYKQFKLFILRIEDVYEIKR